jgi:AcrR family transcriptional regulator
MLFCGELVGTIVATKRKTSTSVISTDREFVLTNAARLFRENGFERTTVKQIADACGMLPGSLHYRYPSKQALLADIMRTGLNRATNLMMGSINDKGSVAERLRRGLYAHIHELVDNADIVYVLLFEWRSLQGAEREELVRMRDRYQKIWDGMLEYLVAQKVFRSDVNPAFLRLIALGALHGVVTWITEDGCVDDEEIANFVWIVIRDAMMGGRTQ